MIVKLLFFSLSFVLAGSQFPSSSSKILASFNEKILSDDIHSLQAILHTNSKYIDNPAAEKYRNQGFLLAVQEGRTPIVEFLLKNANVDAAANNNEAIRLASATGYNDIVKVLLARPDVDPGAMDNEALLAAAKNGHTEIIRLLLAHPKVQSSARDYLGILLASKMNHADIVKLFMNDGRTIPTSVGYRTLEQAARYGNVDLVRFLLGYTSFSDVIHLIVDSDDVLSIMTVVEAGYKLDQETLERSLRYAKSRGNDDISKYLKSLKEKPKPPLIPMTEQCAICLADDNLLEGYMTFCNHQSHAECLQKWIAKHNSCPMCLQ